MKFKKNCFGVENLLLTSMDDFTAVKEQPGWKSPRFSIGRLGKGITGKIREDFIYENSAYTSVSIEAGRKQPKKVTNVILNTNFLIRQNWPGLNQRKNVKFILYTAQNVTNLVKFGNKNARMI